MIFFTHADFKTTLVITASCLVLFSHHAFSQIPTNQDCLGATPVCQQVYNTPSSTFGTGNYPNEQGPGTCLIPGEYNSSWYTFNISSSGVFAFTITPVNPGTDYDWALYNLTNAICSDIQTNGSLMVSCNSSQYGLTGISSTGVGNWNGAGPTNAFNYLINVTAGETYVLNINNWSGTTGGYSVDFGASTASIFDTVKPKIDTILPVICNDNQLTFTFSENILCNTVQDQDFQLTGPGGPYTMSSIAGPACAAGGNSEATFTGLVSPPITVGGNYLLHITNLSGSVTDACSNTADTGSLSFYVSSVVAVLDSMVQPTCGGNNGAIYVSGTVGTPPYLFSLNGGPYLSNGSFTNLDSGTFVIVVKDSFACDDSLIINLLPGTGAVQASIISYNDVNCFNACDGWIDAKGSGGVSPYTYAWTNGAGTTNTVTGLCPGLYKVTITDSYDCLDSTSVTLIEPPEVHFEVLDLEDAICNGYKDGSVALKVTGGNPPYTYIWSPYGGGNDTAIGLGAGIYNVRIIDIHQCNYDTSITIDEPAAVSIIYSGDTTICFGTDAYLHMNAVGGYPPYTVQWDGGISADNPFTVDPFFDTTYTAIAYDDTGCFSKPVTYVVQVQQKPLIDLGKDTVLCYGNVLFEDLFFPGAEYRWQDGSVFFDYAIREPGLYTVDAFNSCFHAYDTIDVVFDDCGNCVHVPTAFTPNGDGLNDVFLPAINCVFTNYSLKVFNRWGQMLFYSNDPNEGWDGRNSTQPSELGTYVWLLEYKGEEHEKQLSAQMKGSVTLLR